MVGRFTSLQRAPLANEKGLRGPQRGTRRFRDEVTILSLPRVEPRFLRSKPQPSQYTNGPMPALHFENRQNILLYFQESILLVSIQ